MPLETKKRYGTWTGTAIEQFLQSTRVPLRLSIVAPGGPIIVPVWFEYRAHSLWCCSPDDSFLVEALRAQPEVAFDISTNDLPYQGVRGRGIAHCSTATDKTALEDLTRRYLSDLDNDLARWLLGRDSAEAIIRVDIDWITSWDFSARMNGLQSVSQRYPDSKL